MTLGEAVARRSTVSEFRSDIPAIKPPPERDAWKRAHGKAPVRVETEPRFVDRALECISRDNSTIEREEAIRVQASLDDICESVRATIIPEPAKDEVVLFDRETKAFYGESS